MPVPAMDSPPSSHNPTKKRKRADSTDASSEEATTSDTSTPGGLNAANNPTSLTANNPTGPLIHRIPAELLSQLLANNFDWRSLGKFAPVSRLFHAAVHGSRAYQEQLNLELPGKEFVECTHAEHLQWLVNSRDTFVKSLECGHRPSSVKQVIQFHELCGSSLVKDVVGPTFICKSPYLGDLSYHRWLSPLAAQWRLGNLMSAVPHFSRLQQLDLRLPRRANGRRALGFLKIGIAELTNIGRYLFRVECNRSFQALTVARLLLLCRSLLALERLRLNDIVWYHANISFEHLLHMFRPLKSLVCSLHASQSLFWPLSCLASHVGTARCGRPKVRARRSQLHEHRVSRLGGASR